MTEWTAEEVVSFDERGADLGSDRIRLETPDYLLFLVPGSYTLTLVRRFRSTPDRADALIGEIRARALDGGATGLRWAVTPLTTPADLAERLVRRGFVPLAPAETLYLPLGTKADPRLPPSRHRGTVSVREAITDSEIDLFVHLGEQIFGDPTPPPDYLPKFRTEVRRTQQATGHSELFLACDGDLPVGRGGLSVTGTVARLWTSGVLPEHRGKGAYTALVRERCRVAIELGAELALTHANIGTSGPILKARGFRSAGRYDYYELRPE